MKGRKKGGREERNGRTKTKDRKGRKGKEEWKEERIKAGSRNLPYFSFSFPLCRRDILVLKLYCKTQP